jgi:hypothetical protein
VGDVCNAKRNERFFKQYLGNRTKVKRFGRVEKAGAGDIEGAG